MDSNLLSSEMGGARERKKARQRQMEDMELQAGGTGATGGGGGGGGEGDTRTVPSGGPPRDGSQYQSRLPQPDSVPGAGPGSGVGGSTGAGGGFFVQRDHLYEVDQSVNLMDPMAGTYERQDQRRTNPIIASLREACDKAGPKKVMIVILVIVAILGVTLRMTADERDFRKGHNAHGGHHEVMVPPDEHDILNLKATDRQGMILEILTKHSVTKRNVLEGDDPSSPQYRALDWIANHDPLKVKIESSNVQIIIQRYVLAVLYYATHKTLATAYQTTTGFFPDVHTEWTHHDHWLSGSSYCNWYGISCVAMGDQMTTTALTNGNHAMDNVIRLNLTSNNLIGTIPPEIKALEQLRELDLSDNEIGGTIPIQLYRMFHLHFLILNNNQFTGSIQSEIKMLDGVRDIFLNNNRLTGTIPTEINKLFNLRGLYLAHNSLIGTIPNMLGMHNLAFLQLQNNQLHSSFPMSLAMLPSLYELHIQNNEFSGTLPPEISNLSNLQLFYGNNNQFRGKLPNVFSNLEHLEQVHLGENQFTGDLPTSLGSITTLKHLRLENNQISGSLPTEFGLLTNLEILNVTNNTMIGSIPSEYGSMTKLQDLILDHNKFDGALPAELSQCTQLKSWELEHNSIGGTIPTEYGQFLNLVKFRFHANDITGAVPQEMCNLKSNGALRFLVADCESDDLTCDCCTNCH